MKRLKKHLLVMTVLAVFAIAGTMMNSRPASASGSAPVNIVSPLPLPVTGSTSVSGTVAATQSGTWNVGLTGTPSVVVSNGASAPALVKDVTAPGQSPFVRHSALSSIGRATFLNDTGKRWIVLFAYQEVDFVPAGIRPVSELSINSGVDLKFPTTSAGVFFVGATGTEIWTASEALHLNVEPGETFECDTPTTGTVVPTSASGSCMISGYLVE